MHLRLLLLQLGLLIKDWLGICLHERLRIDHLHFLLLKLLHLLGLLDLLNLWLDCLCLLLLHHLHLLRSLT